jgi:diguanylate cyclase (GGDEF)-like protein
MLSEYPSPALLWTGILLLLLVCALLVRSFSKIYTINKRMSASDERRSRAMLTDTSTGLLNRLGLETSIANRQKNADQEESSFCAICIKVDDWGLHAYAASLGPDTNDLRKFSEILTQSCPKDYEIGFMNGSEFFIISSGNSSVATDFSRKLLSNLAASARGAHPHNAMGLTFSLGIANYPEHGDHAQLLLHSSIAAHRAANEELRVPFVYTPQLSRDLREQTLLLADLRQAAAQNQFEIFFQPKVDTHTLKITAVEALVRWRHPIRGLISPSIFIPIAERTGLIGEIGDWVITEACAAAGVLHKMGLRMRVAINISGYQLRRKDLADRLEHELKKNHVSPERFTCEITETVAMEDSDATRITFEALRALGLHVSIDDFGTGHSSLAQLRKLPASELKVDRSFVSDLVHSEGARTITGSIISMAKALNLRVVAEGVETRQQCEILKEMGCDELQGYLFSMPIPAADMFKLAMSAPGHKKTPDFSATLYDSTIAMPLR